MARVISHQMERIIGREPLSDGIDLSGKDEAIDVTRNEHIDIGIEHDQKTVHFWIESTDESGIDRRCAIANAVGQRRNVAQVDVRISAVNVAQLPVTFAVRLVHEIMINSNNVSRILFGHCQGYVPQIGVVASENGSVVSISE